MYQLKTESSFDAAHFLTDYDGKCENLHGHRWRVVAFISAKELQRTGQEKDMVVDFAAFKAALRDLTEFFDHMLIMEEGSLAPATVEALEDETFSLITVPWRTTSENFARYFAERLAALGFAVSAVEVYETPLNCAIYRPGDAAVAGANRAARRAAKRASRRAAQQAAYERDCECDCECCEDDADCECECGCEDDGCNCGEQGERGRRGRVLGWLKRRDGASGGCECEGGDCAECTEGEDFECVAPDECIEPECCGDEACCGDVEVKPASACECRCLSTTAGKVATGVAAALIVGTAAGIAIGVRCGLFSARKFGKLLGIR